MDAVKTFLLTKYYGKSRGIIDIDLTVKEGDFFGFIGPNGAGKSTMIRTLLGLISPSCGTAEIFGKDICKNRDEILSITGYMPSEANFYNNMRVSEVIKLSAGLRHKDCSGEAHRLCDRLELDVKRKINELSLGNRKKVSIVCALLHKPRLCVLDEPTSGLDPLMQREFYEILKERNKEGATIFLSSHILSEIQRYCSHAAVIREGRILAVDSIENLGHAGAKRVTVSGISKSPELNGIKDVSINGDTVSFLYGGKPDILLSTLASMSPTDVNIAEPDLEEIFMHYYAKEGEEHDTLKA